MRRRLSLLALAAVLSTALPAAGQAALPHGFVDELVAVGMELPVGFARLPDGRVLVVEQFSAKIRIVENTIVSDVAVVPDVSTIGERGLLGIAIDPGWPQRPYVYVQYPL